MNKLDLVVVAKIWEKIQTAEKILLHCHRNADPDSIGGALAMAKGLESIGKLVTIIRGENVFDYGLCLLPGSKSIKPIGLEKINIEDFDLFLIQDSAAWNMVSSIVAEDSIPSNKKVVIDHHYNQIRADLKLVSEEYGSNCEQIFEILKLWNIKITPEIATNLYVGMYTDSGGFCFPKTDERTLKIASDLWSVNPKMSDFMLKFSSSIEKKIFLLQLEILKHLVELCNGKVVVATISFEEMQNLGIDVKKARANVKSMVSGKLKEVVGWEIAACGMEVEPGKVEYSLRSKDGEKYNVSQFARKFAIGGGHPAAAGLTMSQTNIPDSILNLEEKMKEMWPELSKPNQLPANDQ